MQDDGRAVAPAGWIPNWCEAGVGIGWGAGGKKGLGWWWWEGGVAELAEVLGAAPIAPPAPTTPKTPRPPPERSSNKGGKAGAGAGGSGKGHLHCSSPWRRAGGRPAAGEGLRQDLASPAALPAQVAS